MFTKVLVIDDHDDITKNVSEILKSFGVADIQNSQYCDNANLKIQRAALDQVPFDLVITDLSFKEDHRECKLKSGEELIAEIRSKFPEVPIIVYSMKDQLQRVRSLVNKYRVNAYVCKDRKGSLELSVAIKEVSNNNIFLSPQIQGALSKKEDIEIDDYDIELLKQLSTGLLQDKISVYFKKNNISPNSLSSVEKRINKLRIQFRANNTTHLVTIVKDLGLI